MEIELETSGRGGGYMWSLDQKIDQPIKDEEAGHVKAMDSRKELSTSMVLRLAFQSLGVVYGDLGTSPLYVFSSTFPDGIQDSEDVMGALSLIIYTLTLIPLLKYVFVALRADDNGEGGTFALYSLLCRHAKVNTIPNQHPTDEELTAYSRQNIKDKSVAARTKKWLEAKVYRQNALLLLVLVGTSMVIGDGILTPAISVLSSIGGIKVDHAKIHPRINSAVVVAVSVVILVILFSLQHYGTDKVGWLFAPAIFLWFLCIGSVGAYNICKHDPYVLKAFSPVYIVQYLRGGKKRNWISLGGIMLSITGTEALFADLGHFSTLAVQIAFTSVVFPCLLLQYMGQAAYLLHHQNDVQEAFHRSIPALAFWPVFVIATVAAVIASQATISATFSIIKQAIALGCFPRLKVLHTSKDFSGQIYIPEINWILMVLCIIVTVSFERTSQIGNAYGTAVIIVMLVTTILMSLVMLVVWRSNWLLVLLFTSFFLFIELIYFSSVLFKINQGGWVPLVIAGVFLIIMYVWHYGTVKRYEFQMESRVSMAWILGLGPSLGLVRVPGTGLLYTELVNGVPSIFSHLITNIPAIHSVVIFVCVKYLPVNTVLQEERFLVRRIGPTDFHMFRCVARYGYKDLHKKDDNFEKMLLDNLIVFIQHESLKDSFSDPEDYSLCEDFQQEPTLDTGNTNLMSVGMVLAESSQDSIVSERTPNQSGLHVRFTKDFQQEPTLDTGNTNLMSLGMVLAESSQDSIVSERTPHRSGLHVRFTEGFQQEPTLDTGNTNLMSLGMFPAESSQNSIVSERTPHQSGLHVRFTVPNTGTVDDEVQFLNDCRDSGVVHILGNTVVRARRGSFLIKKIAVDYIYAFLLRICREDSAILNVPHESLLTVGQVFYV